MRYSPAVSALRTNAADAGTKESQTESSDCLLILMNQSPGSMYMCPAPFLAKGPVFLRGNRLCTKDVFFSSNPRVSGYVFFLASLREVKFLNVPPVFRCQVSGTDTER